MKIVHLIAAARPNFMKVAPVWHELSAADWCKPMLIHTGQHYDTNMSDSFFSDLRLPEPDFHLGVGSGTHAEQTANVMVAYEKILTDTPPDCTIVVGDVNSTLACTLAAKKLCLPVAHLEAGLRSGDRTMPEEINRIVTDSISDVLWTPSKDADENLRREGVSSEKISCIGNIMIDSFELLRDRIEDEAAPASYSLEEGKYGVVTLHRPSNVDDEETLRNLVETLINLSGQLTLIFAIHPRTRKNLEQFNLLRSLESAANIQTTEPLSYVRFMSLVCKAGLVITDSGGIQEETTYLGIPCLTLRDSTERPITITQGTNRLATAETLSALANDALDNVADSKCPPLWDGKTAGRLADDLKSRYG